ncbi:GtrA family protein [Nitratireductor kimnyeongensis]|uniref:GtrA family protein n=1 Tax=Nitratireductor kimnyeongensis TaxID=430679 RepID=A0ABW0T4D2_9HYPH|nr:GtrA family protein [Nitratireductor kimnyeongensis]QZZ35287.1 GtrA family protein [Nitratireductor kimnyeongensis]
MNRQADRPVTKKLGRFAIVGLLNTLIDLATFSALVALSFPALVANFLGWGVAVIFSFAVNSRWTFERGERFNLHKAFAKFAVSGSIISLGSSSLAVYFLPPLTGLFAAKLVGIIVGAILNFFAARWSIENRII